MSRLGGLAGHFRGPSLYIWDHIEPDGAGFLRFFFLKTLVVSRGSKNDIRKQLLTIREVLSVSIESNYWSVCWRGDSSMQLRRRMLDLLGEYQGWNDIQKARMQRGEIVNRADYQALLKDYPRVVGWYLKDGD